MIGTARGIGRGLIVTGVLGAASLGVGVLSGAAVHAEAEATAAAEIVAPKLVVVKFHADWCGKCRAMAAPLAETQASLIDESVLFVTFDFTDQTTARHSGYLASLAGYETIWENYERRTGFLLLVNGETGEVLSEIKRADPAAIESAIREHLS